MFKKENRLAPGEKFGNSYSVTLPQLMVKIKKNNLPINRFGVIVSKKVDKSAVGRNKIKRFIRSMIMDLSEKMSVGHDILLIVKKEILNKIKEENSIAIENALGKAGIIKNKK